MDRDLEYVIKELAQYIIKGENKGKNAYKKEKIVQLDKNSSDINQIYKKFKKIENDNYWSLQDDELFYWQAKYVENFEDDYEPKIERRNSYTLFVKRNTYSDFTLSDFRTYFSWRTKIRKGIFEKIDFEYEQIYINELLNKIGCKDTNDAVNKLIEFWSEYRKYSSDLDGKMPDIIKEFYIINTINIPYREYVKKYPIKLRNTAKDLKDIKKGIYSNKIEFFNEISSYKIAQSKLLETKYGYVLDECTEKVFNKIHQEFEKVNISLPDMLVRKNETEHYWQPLRRYTVYEEEEKDKEFILEGTEKYQYKNGIWTRIVYSAQVKYRNMMGYILKAMEYNIRDYLGYRKLKHPEEWELARDGMYCYSEKEIKMILKINQMNIKEIVEEETLKYLENTKIPKMVFKKKKLNQNEFEQEEKIEIVFNQEQFEKLREKSEEIQKALIIEDEEKEIESIEEQTKNTNIELEKIEEEKQEQALNENIFKVFVEDLTKTEKEIVNVLLQKQDIENKILQIAKAQNEMLEVIVSNINDKALETIGDTIIESNMTSIYEDYEEDIKQVF